MRIASWDPEMIQILLFEPPGILASDETIKGIERSFSRQEFRRTSPGEIGTLTYPTRATSSYVQELLGALDRDAIAERGLRLVLNYNFSAASLVMPSLVGDLGVEMVALNAFVDSSANLRGLDVGAALDETGRLVRAIGADLGVVIDNAAERVWLIDENGAAIPPETTLLLLVRELSLRACAARCSCRSPRRGWWRRSRSRRGTASWYGGRRRRRATCLPRPPGRTTSSSPGRPGGGYVFPDFLLAVRRGHVDREDPRDRVAVGQDALGARPRPAASTLVHQQAHCPWSAKGTAMRQVIEAVKGLEVDDTDGIKVFEDSGWAQIIPDPDEPVFHIYAEGATREDSLALEAKYRAMLDGFVAAASLNPQPELEDSAVPKYTDLRSRTIGYSRHGRSARFHDDL